MDHIRRLRSSFSAYHGRIDKVRSFTRLRDKPPIKLFGEDTKTARLARAQTIVAQARSFIQSSAVTIEVEPLDNSAREQEITSKLERWLQGAQYAAMESGNPTYRDALWHYFESGQWIVRTLFDVDLAMKGEFPFCIDAIDPRTFSFKRSNRGLMYACIEERKYADVVMHELQSYYNSARTPTWEIPQSLKDKRSTDQVTVVRYYDEEREYLFVDTTPVWSKPHLMPRVPFDMAFCNDVPATGDMPEEMGMGIIYPIVDELEMESTMLTKMTSPIELFFFPLFGVRTNNSYEIKQAYPGQRWELGSSEAPAPMDISPTPNYQVLQELQTRIESDINRATFPEAVFGPMEIQLSGYAYTQALSGLQERLKDYAREPERALGRHFSLLLWCVSHFSNRDVMEALGMSDYESSEYQRSFSVVQKAPENGYKRVKTRVQLNEKDIDGHAIVHVSLQPNLDRDESSKYQRAAIAKTQLGLPDDFIYRDVLKLERPDEVVQSKSLEELKLQNPEFAEFMLDDELNQVLTRDKELRVRFEMWRQAKQMVMSEQMAQMANQQAMGIDPSTGMPLGAEQGQAMEQGANAPTPEQLAQAGQQGNPESLPQVPTGAMVPPGAGGIGMPPMESMPNTPVSPEELLLQQMGAGGPPQY